MTTENYDIVINERGGKTVKRTLDDIAQSAQRADQSLKGVDGGLSRSSGVVDAFTTSLKFLGAALATVRLGSLINESAKLSQRYNELGIVLDTVGRNAGLLKS